MKEDKELKMEILREFATNGDLSSIDFCREAYKFITENSSEEHYCTTIKDGVYYVTHDNTLLTDCNTITKDYIKGVLVSQGERKLIVALEDAVDGEATLTEKGYDPDRVYTYLPDNIDAVSDWGGKSNTEHLKKFGLNSKINLKDGWYIPSAGEMLFIFSHLNSINKLLERIGANPLELDWYWTSTGASSTAAWSLNLNNGYLSRYTKATYSGRVRPVSAFII